RGDATGTGTRHARRDPPRRREKEMAGAAGRVEHGNGKERRTRIVGLRLDAVEQRVERGIEQRLHQAIRRVVAAGGLAGMALGLAGSAKAKPCPSSMSRGVSSSRLSYTEPSSSVSMSRQFTGTRPEASRSQARRKIASIRCRLASRA